MQGTNPLTMKCTYITPCGWCARQNKECDLEETKKRNKKYRDLFKSHTAINKICETEEDHQWECCGMDTGGSTYRCKICGEHKTVPIKSQETVTISTHFNEGSIPCFDCTRVTNYSPQCIDCNTSNGFKYFEKENTND